MRTGRNKRRDRPTGSQVRATATAMVATEMPAPTANHRPWSDFVRLRRMHGLQSGRLLGFVDLLGNLHVGVGVIDVVPHLIDGRASHGELPGNFPINAGWGRVVAATPVHLCRCPAMGKALPRATMEARQVDELPRDKGWQFEPKWDGFRCLASRDGAKVELIGRSGKSLARYFPEIVAALARLAGSALHRSTASSSSRSARCCRSMRCRCACIPPRAASPGSPRRRRRC